MTLAIRTAKGALVGSLVLVFSVSTNVIGIYLALKNLVLLERRIKAGPDAETRPAQKVIIALAFVGAIALVIFAVLDHRFGWSHMPVWVSVLGNVLVALGLMIDLRVFRENSYGASTADQKVVATGPYALVRHPMYVGVLVMIIGVPLALGSYWGLLFLLLDVPILVLRILNEEKMLVISTAMPTIAEQFAIGWYLVCGDGRHAYRRRLESET